MRILLRILARLLIVGAMGLCLFSEPLMRGSSGGVGTVLREVLAVFRDPGTQWMVMACLLVYFGTFRYLAANRRSSRREEAQIHPIPAAQSQEKRQQLWSLLTRASTNWFGQRALAAATGGWGLVMLVLLSLAAYARSYASAVSSLDALTLMGMLVLGQALAFWISLPAADEARHARSRFIAVALLGLLAGAALYHSNPEFNSFAYLGRQRWTGPWTNPNVYGVLMGAALLLGVGVLLSSGTKEALWVRWCTRAFCVCALPLLCAGLLSSYSRGAWLATTAGMTFLIASRMCGRQAGPRAFAFRNRVAGAILLPSFIILAGVLTLTALNFRGSEQPHVRRIASMANRNDFSWRNRVTAWEGALQMMAEKPILGQGWGRAEALYESFYKPAGIDSGAAIQMNDYLMMGASAGVPALAAFLVFIGALGYRVWSARQETSSQEAVFAATALVMAISFWFDGGLFKVPTSAVFWVMASMSGPDRLSTFRIQPSAPSAKSTHTFSRSGDRVRTTV